MSVWWRQSRDRNGLTIFDKLESELRYMVKYAKDIMEYSTLSDYHAHKSRTASILRRLKICPHCRGTTVDFTQAVLSGDGDCPCQSCGGSGRITVKTND